MYEYRLALFNWDEYSMIRQIFQKTRNQRDEKKKPSFVTQIEIVPGPNAGPVYIFRLQPGRCMCKKDRAIVSDLAPGYLVHTEPILRPYLAQKKKLLIKMWDPLVIRLSSYQLS